MGIGDFTLSPECLKAITELTWQNTEVPRKITALMKNSSNRIVVVAIGSFLFKLRAGNSNAVTAFVFGIECELLISDIYNSVTNSFVKDLLHLHFRFFARNTKDLF